jgi:hypothetical protein
MIHPPNQCSLELIKTFRTSLFNGRQMKPKRQTPKGRLGPLRPAHTFKRVSQEDPGAKQTHHRSQHFEHCEYPSGPTCEETRHPPTQSKRFKSIPAHCPRSADFVQQMSRMQAIKGNQTAGWPRNSTADRFNDWFTKANVSPFPPCSGCDIVRSRCEGWSHRRGVLPMAAE